MWQGSAETGECYDMTRRLLILAAFLLAGVVVNVAVAWGCALWSPTKGGESIRYVKGLPDELKALMPSGWLTPAYRGSIWLWQGRSLGFGVRISKVGSAELLPPGSGIPLLAPTRVVNFHRAGWPVHSMRCRVLVTRETRTEPQVLGGFTPNAVLGARTLRTRRFLSPPLAHSHPVPCRPIWPGFAVNAIFYAAVLWLLIPGPFALRRLIRVRRGLCPACAYPLGGSAVCSECGKALPQHAKATT